MSIDEHRTDHELVEKLHRGNIEAFDQIYIRYSERLFGFAFKYLKSKEETEELVQDVFLKIWEKRKNIKKESSLKSYLFTITYHNMCRIFRARQVHLKFIESNKIYENLIINPEEQIKNKEIIEQVDKLIKKLPQKQKEIFLKSRNDGKSTYKIAEEMNLAPGTINNNISAALKFLKVHLTSEDFA